MFFNPSQILKPSCLLSYFEDVVANIGRSGCVASLLSFYSVCYGRRPEFAGNRCFFRSV